MRIKPPTSCKITAAFLKAGWSADSPEINQSSAWPATSALIEALTPAFVAFVVVVLQFSMRQVYEGWIDVFKQFPACIGAT